MAELTAASFNVHCGRAAHRQREVPFDVVAAAAELDADVLVLLETWAPDGEPSQHDRVATALGYEVASVSCGRAVVEPRVKVVSRPDPDRAKGAGDWCTAVLSRLPVRDVEVVRFPQLPTDPAARALVRATVDVAGTPLHVHGTHLSHLEMGVLALHRRALRAALAPATEPGALLGDMNMWGWCIGWMAPPGWTRHGAGATFPAVRPVARIDHVLTTSSVEVVQAEVVRDLGSDHRPIRARLRIREGA